MPKTAPDGVAGPSAAAFTDSNAAEEGQKEFWRVKTFIRCGAPCPPSWSSVPETPC